MITLVKKTVEISEQGSHACLQQKAAILNCCVCLHIITPTSLLMRNRCVSRLKYLFQFESKIIKIMVKDTATEALN